mgnify:CR=1 FL=1
MKNIFIKSTIILIIGGFFSHYGPIYLSIYPPVEITETNIYTSIIIGGACCLAYIFLFILAIRLQKNISNT